MSFLKSVNWRKKISRKRNNKPLLASCGLKKFTNTKDRIKLLEGQIKIEETALELSEASFLDKEKDLQQKFEEFER
ncbi:hypothetical protein LXL04_003995 [Taraxacum kok-saghyz]